jgi:hypothetical protein
MTTLGRGRHGEEGVGKVAKLLVTRLNMDSAQWSDPECQKAADKDDVDCVVRDGEKLLRIQITRALREQNFWIGLSKSRRANKVFSNPEEAADAL